MARSDPDPYQSARDLPSIAEMIQQLQGGKLLTRVIARSQRKELVKLETELNRMTQTVDDFYALLGPRHWIFHDALSLDKVQPLLALSADDAERKFVDLYKDPEQLSMFIGRLRRYPQVRVRSQLIERAREDYLAERYDSTVLLLITVMDGFVNDIEVEHGRRGLHARDESEMVAWDSLVGHHQGLTRAHRTFTKSFAKTSDEEVQELYRNGIVHGMLVNFNNDIVATKAWNRLFAVADWATSREKQAPRDPPPTLRGLFKSLMDFAESQKERDATKKALDEWSARTLSEGGAGFEDDPVFEATTTYLAAWQKRNYGAMAGMLWTHARDDNLQKTAGQVREECQLFSLHRFLVQSLDHEAPAICEVDVELTLGCEMKPARLRWLREGGDGIVVAPNQAGEWRLVNWGPMDMLYNVKREADED